MTCLQIYFSQFFISFYKLKEKSNCEEVNLIIFTSYGDFNRKILIPKPKENIHAILFNLRCH